jgi:hypothetical protein
MNSIEKSVLPAPASPQIREGRPVGKPPAVISSKPVIPVGVLDKEIVGGDFFDVEGMVNEVLKTDDKYRV